MPHIAVGKRKRNENKVNAILYVLRFSFGLVVDAYS